VNIDIASILSNFVVAAVVMYMADRERKILLDRLAQLEKRLEDLNQRYLEDLRDWSGIYPKFKTWSGRKTEPLESDTKIRTYMLRKEEEERAQDLMNK